MMPHVVPKQKEVLEHQQEQRSEEDQPAPEPEAGGPAMDAPLETQLGLEHTDLQCQLEQQRLEQRRLEEELAQQLGLIIPQLQPQLQ